MCRATVHRSGSKHVVAVRVVQVGSSVYKIATVNLGKKYELFEASEDLANDILAKVAALENRPISKTKSAKTTPIPKDAVRPTVAVRMLETAVARRVPDPASEIRLIKILKDGKFKSIQLSQRGQSVQAGENKLLEGKAFEDYVKEVNNEGVEVVILGEAFSEAAGRIGNVVCARARVEVHAIRVSDKQVLLTSSGYGAGTDVAIGVAGKKAIGKTSGGQWVLRNGGWERK